MSHHYQSFFSKTWGYVHGERGKGSVEEEENEEEENEEESNDRGVGVPNEGCDHVRQDRGTERAEGKFRRSAEGERRRSR